MAERGKNTGGISEAEIAVSMMKKVWYYERKKFANQDLRRDCYEKGIGIIWGINLHVVIRRL